MVGNYFDEGRWWPRNPDRLLADIGWHHRTMSTLFNAFLTAGFILERVVEPRPDPALLADAPIYGQVAEVLVARWRRAEHASEVGSP